MELILFLVAQRSFESFLWSIDAGRCGLFELWKFPQDVGVEAGRSDVTKEEVFSKRCLRRLFLHFVRFYKYGYIP